MQNVIKIDNIPPSLVEVGKIKIGRKGKKMNQGQRNEFRLPEKLDHFLITTMEKDGEDNFLIDKELHTILKSLENLKKIPVTLLHDSIPANLQTRYACYKGTNIFCQGNGKKAVRIIEKVETEVKCPCDRLLANYPNKKEKCKPNATLSVIINGAEIVGGVWKFRTVGFNSVKNLIASMELIKTITGGPLAGLPLELILTPKTAKDSESGRNVKIYIVSMVYRGTVESLMKRGLSVLENRKMYELKVKNVDERTEKLLLTEQASFEETNIEDTISENYPDNLDDSIPETKDLVPPQENEGEEITGDGSGEALPETQTQKGETKLEVKKGRGRPKGSKGKDKPVDAKPDPVETKTEPEAKEIVQVQDEETPPAEAENFVQPEDKKEEKDTFDWED